MDEKGAYLFNKDNPHLFLYMKLSKELLKIALPISYKEDRDKNYLTVIFEPNGVDYLAQSSLTDINNFHSKEEIFDILNKDKEECDMNINTEKFNEWKEFSFQQLRLSPPAII